MSAGHLFGYASLVRHAGPRARPAMLPSHRRVWGVAADNSRAIPGYKIYLRRSDGARPAVYVAFLDLQPHPRQEVEGLVRPVSRGELEELDRRERNYDRVEVSAEVEVAGRRLDGPVWAYRGSPAGRARLRRARAEGRAVVSRDYAEGVTAGFRRLGEGAHERFLASSELGGLPVWDLERVDLPPHPPLAGEAG